MGMDCSSIPEIHLAQIVGVTGEGIMFTSNNTSVEDFATAKEAGAIINLDDFSHIAKLESV
jgi:diaminopimelate decarboxylase